tara:strand:+ start:325 stop:684 length:360 start_codon:yes stop_codon:yes gene_type:complete
MALAKTGLGGITAVSGDSTSAVYTVSSSKTAYIRGLTLFNTSSSASIIVSIHVVPHSGGSAGTAGATNKLARITLSANDTYFLEFAYPITLSDNGDTIQVNAETASIACNVLVIGDKES